MKEGEKNPTTPWDIVELLSCVGIGKGKTSPFISGSWHWIIPYPAPPSKEYPLYTDPVKRRPEREVTAHVPIRVDI